MTSLCAKTGEAQRSLPKAGASNKSQSKYANMHSVKGKGAQASHDAHLEGGNVNVKQLQLR
jgi:hypothetical protein